MAEGDGDKIRKPGDGELDLEAEYDTNRTGCFPWFNIEHRLSLQEVESRNGRARKSPHPTPMAEPIPRLLPGEEVRTDAVEQTGPECRRGDLWGLEKGQEILQMQKWKRGL